MPTRSDGTKYIISTYAQADSTTTVTTPRDIQTISNRQHYRRSSKEVNLGKIENAVYSHIRAVRALGRTNISTSDIAESLSLAVNEVNRAVMNLRKKGIRAL